MKKILITLFCILGIVCFSSCGITSYQAKYNVGLVSVESPLDTKQQFGDTKIQNFTENESIKYQFEDDYINIIWYVSSKQFNFALTNKSSYTIKINWDDISYVDINGIAGRVIHSGIRYVDKNNSQASTSIPRGSTISDILLPVNNIYYGGQYVGWQEKVLIPSFYQSKEAMENGAPTYVGKQMIILMPIIIENVKNDYVFTFNINELM